jgi:hypothetical protein
VSNIQRGVSSSNESCDSSVSDDDARLAVYAASGVVHQNGIDLLERTRIQYSNQAEGEGSIAEGCPLRRATISLVCVGECAHAAYGICP